MPLGTRKHILFYLSLSNEYALSTYGDVTSVYTCVTRACIIVLPWRQYYRENPAIFDGVTAETTMKEVTDFIVT